MEKTQIKRIRDELLTKKDRQRAIRKAELQAAQKYADEAFYAYCDGVDDVIAEIEKMTPEADT